MEGHDKKYLFLIAGEPSGDMIGARLMRALEKKNPNLVFAGIGGSQMEAAGLKSFFPMQELSVMGLAEVLPRLPALLRRIRQTAAEVVRVRPDALITIDSPDFCFRVARKVKASAPDIACIHYVAPTVWAWRPGRAKKIAAFLDHLLALFPFEPPYFEKEGLSCDFVGHPLMEAGGSDRGNGKSFRVRYGIPESRKILTVLPGSRMGEISRLLPDFMRTARLLKEKFPDLAVVVPTLPHLASFIRVSVDQDVIVVASESEKQDAFAASDAALAASGTVTLELALAGLPSVLAYRVSPLTAWIGRRMIRVRHVGLVNILLGREAMPEFLQENCRADKLSAALADLLQGGIKAESQKNDLAAAAAMLSAPDAQGPSDRAAAVILDCLSARSANAQAA